MNAQKINVSFGKQVSGIYESKRVKQGIHAEDISTELENSTKETGVQEDAIQDVCIFQFDDTGKLAYKRYYSKLDQNDAGGKMVHILLRTDVGAGYLHVLANMGDITADEKFKVGTMTLEQFEKATHPTTLENGMMLEGLLPMSGKTAAPVNSIDLPERIEVQLVRMVAKVTLNLEVKTENFILQGVNLCGVPADLQFTAQSSPVTPTTVKEYTPKKVSGTQITATWYLPENLRGEGTVDIEAEAPLMDRYWKTAPLKSSYVQIIGQRKPLPSEGYVRLDDPVEVRYNIYLGESGNSNNFDIHRNTEYMVDAVVYSTQLIDKRVEHRGGSANCYLVNKSGEWYAFNPQIRGNGAATAAEISYTGKALAAFEPMAPVSAELVWETVGPKQVIAEIKLEDGLLKFKTGPAEEGNAVVCVKDADGKILWSWHIWRSELDCKNIPTQIYYTSPKKVSGFNNVKSRKLEMMDRNIGAFASNVAAFTAKEIVKTYGLFYQGGRKDPFMCVGDWNASTFHPIYTKEGIKKTHSQQLQSPYVANENWSWSITTGITFSIENPQAFILTSRYAHWIPSATVEVSQLWGGKAHSQLKLDYTFEGKTIYDPCPSGFCVPPGDTWTNFLSNGSYTGSYTAYNIDKSNSNMQYGYSFYIKGNSGETAFYPTQGERNRDAGIGRFAELVCIWSHAPITQTNVGFIYGDFGGSTGASVGVYMDYCSLGEPVRCVREKSLLP